MSLAIPHQFRKKESPISSTKVNENNSVIVSYINDLETSLLTGIYNLIPVGTKMVFYQAAAPTGWTLVTGIDDKFMRIVSGGGGSTGGSGVSPSSTVTLSHTHTVDGHTHSTPNHTHILDHDIVSYDAGGASTTILGRIISLNADGEIMGTSEGWTGTPTNIREHKNQTTSGGSGTSGTSSPGTSSSLSNTGFQYADVIVASKD